jgi:cytochrome c-type biogenesis protein CcmH
VIPLALALFALIALSPLALSLRRPTEEHGRRESALALHRAQLAELDRELAEGRIGVAEHATARLEVQRRLLAAADAAETEPTRFSRRPLAVALVVVPIAAAGLYILAGGRPDLPAQPLAARQARAEREAQENDRLIATLRDHLAQLDRNSDMAREIYILLGNAEDERENLPAAAEAWRHALAIRFDPALAALAAEAQTLSDGRVTAESAALFRRALAEGAPDAPWRPLARRRLEEAAGEQEPPPSPAPGKPD